MAEPAPPQAPPLPVAQPGAEAPVAPPSSLGRNVMQQLGVSGQSLNALDAARGVSRDTSNFAMNQVLANRARFEELNEPLPERPAPPKLQEVPAPPAREEPDPLRVFGQVLPVLAMLGGLAVRNNATAALQAGAAAMQAARTNDAEALERAHQEWEDNIQSITANNEVRLSQYQAILDDSRMSMDERLAELNALAASEQNVLRLQQIASGQVSELAAGVQMEIQANQILRDQFLRQQEINAQRQAASQPQMGGAEMRGRLALALPNIVSANNAMNQIELAEGRDGARGNVFNREWGARNLEAIPFDGGVVSRTVGGSDYQGYESASRTFESAMLPIFSGAAVTDSEARRFVRANLPQMGDSPETLATKAANRAALINQASIIVGSEPPFPDAGFFSPLTGLIQRTPADLPSAAPPANAPPPAPGTYDWTPESGLSARR